MSLAGCGPGGHPAHGLEHAAFDGGPRTNIDSGQLVQTRRCESMSGPSVPRVATTRLGTTNFCPSARCDSRRLTPLA